MSKKELRIVFMGTPEFAVAPLRILIENSYNIVGVITSPDKPAGRGQQIQESAIKKFATQQNLKILQPTNLKSTDFIEELKALKANLQIVVAFRMLPEQVWNMPELGTFNLHASLLPQYRGAAPINWSIINGETETGVTTFFLTHEIDTGDIIEQQKVAIGENETAGELHDKLMNIGAKLVLSTTRAIENNSIKTKPQKQNIPNSELKSATKIFKQDCKINWDADIKSIHNKVRGLSPYPTAWTTFQHKEKDEKLTVKIFKSVPIFENHNKKTGELIIAKNSIRVSVLNGFIEILELQIEGKKRMTSASLLNGFNLNSYCIL